MQRRELKPPFGDLDLLAEHSRSNALWATLAALTALAALAAAWILLRHRRRRARRRNAYEVARTRLDQLLARPRPQDPAAIEAFFVAISSIVRRYLEDRFELRAHGIDDGGVSGARGFGQPLIPRASTSVARFPASGRPRQICRRSRLGVGDPLVE